MALTQAQIDALATTVEGIAIAFAPAEAAMVATVVKLATTLNNIVHSIRTNDPALWAKVVELNTTAESDWAASVTAHPGA